MAPPAPEPQTEPQPAEPPAPPPREPHSWSTASLFVVVLVVAALYVGQDIFVPLALAALLAFLLDPVVTRLRRWGLPRALAVVLVIAATVSVLGAASLFVGRQVVQLGHDLPTYQTTIQKKLRALRLSLAEPGVIDEASRVMGAVGSEFEAARRQLEQRSGTRTAPPTRVVVEPPASNVLQAIRDLSAPIVGPLATAAVVLLFLIFILLERLDLRDRLLRLIGSDLHRSTDALGEAADRVTRYLTMQLLINLSYGVPMAVGLWMIGVPGALLWGALASLLRFVPYVGPVIAAAFPLLLAFAVDPGWQLLIWTLILVVSLELISNNVIEPWLYGASTGLSSVSIVVAAVFWTTLWGPVGLILATPITVCLAVMGRHLPQLAWLDMLLGSSPVFDPPTRLYQRLVAGDVEEAIEFAEEQVTASTLADFYNLTGVPALALAANDTSQASRSEHRHRLSGGMAALLHNLRQDHPAPLGNAPGVQVLCVGTRWEIDSLAADMLQHALQCEGLTVGVLPATAVNAEHIQSLNLDGVQVLCLSTFSTTPQAQVRFIARRLQRRQPGLKVVLALWNSTLTASDPASLQKLGVVALAQTVNEAIQRVRALVPAAVGAAAGTVADSGLQLGEEAARVQALHHSGALAAHWREPLDRMAQRAADVFDTPLAMVTLMDEQTQIWHGATGLDAHAPDAQRETARTRSLCEQVVLGGKAILVPDTERDGRLDDQPVIPGAGIRFYAGVPLRSGDGPIIGTLCLMDQEPRTLDDSEMLLLASMASEVMALLQTAPDGQAQQPLPPEPPQPPQPPSTTALPVTGPGVLPMPGAAL